MKALSLALALLVAPLSYAQEDTYHPDENHLPLEEIQREEAELKEEKTMTAKELQRDETKKRSEPHFGPQQSTENSDKKEGSVD